MAEAISGKRRGDDGGKKRRGRRVQGAEWKGARAGGRVGKEASVKTAVAEDTGQAMEELGADLLERAADAAVGENCDRLAKALVEGAVAGDVNCAKILMTLVERRREEKKKTMETAEKPELKNAALEWGEELDRQYGTEGGAT